MQKQEESNRFNTCQISDVVFELRTTLSGLNWKHYPDGVWAKVNCETMTYSFSIYDENEEPDPKEIWQRILPGDTLINLMDKMTEIIDWYMTYTFVNESIEKALSTT